MCNLACARDHVGGGGEPVDRGRQRRISDHGWQFVEAAVGGQHGGGVVVAGDDELVEVGGLDGIHLL
jgi:hypothetical protein